MPRRTTLQGKISLLTLGSALASMLLLGLAFLVMFLIFFSRQETEDLLYVLDTTNEKLEGAMQFVETGVIALQRNAALEGFWETGDDAQARQQLSYSLDLFSQQNLIGQNQPFVISCHLFNNDGAFLAQRFFPVTQGTARSQDSQKRKLWASFLDAPAQYQCLPEGEDLDLCLRLFDEDLRQKGVCILTLRRSSIETVYAPLDTYRDCRWAMYTAGGTLLCASDPAVSAPLLFLEPGRQGAEAIEGRRMIYSAASMAFGLRTAVSVGYENVYTGMRAIMATLLVAMALALVLASAILYSVTRQVTRPLKEMAGEIHAFGTEGLDVRMKDFPIQEFHDISQTFNEMAERISNLITEVYEKQLAAARAQLKFLLAQIDPHFMFNILAMLSIRARSSGDEALYQQLHAFSKLVQGKIFRNAEVRIDMEQELELVRFYLLLQQGRFGEKLTYTITLEDEALKRCRIPRLLIEPLVENAVSHGIEPKQEGGHISVEVSRQEGQLCIVVADDGVGFEFGALCQPPPPAAAHTATGVMNTRELLKVLYGQRSSMQIDTRPGSGTRVEIRLPLEF